MSARPGRAGIVWLAIRPRTLTAALVPVAVGTALAARAGAFRPLAALTALAGAVLIQIATNLVNDVHDFERGADTAERTGPLRVTQAGLVSPAQMHRAALATFVAALLPGVYLVAVGGWPIALVGVASLLSGYAYTAGPYPLGYHGLGDLFVFLFFGVIAVSGTYWVQAGRLDAEVLLCSLPVAALATALLVVNNLRDVQTDARAGKRTLAVRFGAASARWEYVALLTAAFATPVALFATGQRHWPVLLALAAAPIAAPPLVHVLHEEGRALNAALAATARLQLLFGLLFAVGLWRG